jgi:hypothetical protein
MKTNCIALPPSSCVNQYVVASLASFDLRTRRPLFIGCDVRAQDAMGGREAAARCAVPTRPHPKINNGSALQ